MIVACENCGAEHSVGQPCLTCNRLEQPAQMKRVSERIAGAIIEFFRSRHDGILYYGEELRQWVIGQVGVIAPASATTVMRDLRQKGIIGYEVVSRKDSLYMVTEPTGVVIPRKQRTGKGVR